MRKVAGQTGWGLVAPGAALLIVCLASAAAQTGGESSAAPAKSDNTSLVERQRNIRNSMQRLENRMLELARLLELNEPEKAERLREALNLSGKKRIRAQLEALVELFSNQKISGADRAQDAVLSDLSGLLELLTSSLNELDRLRERRKQLEATKQAIRKLIDEQRQNLYRTQHARQSTEREQRDLEEPAGAEPPDLQTSDGDDLERLFLQLEKMQRELQRQAAEVARGMQPPDDDAEPLPGAPQMQEAQQGAQRAADRLGRQQPAEAEREQQSVLEQMQEALDELEDTLRQLRQEEREETLSALEGRLRGMLESEIRVREIVLDLDEKPADALSRLEALQIGEARELHAQVIEDARATLRILTDEGTTVVVPELLRQMVEDMVDVLSRLERSDVSGATVVVLDQVIALLEEVLAAVERQRDLDAEGRPPPNQQRQGEQSQPLLPLSAELKLMRSSQVRLNDRTATLHARAVTEADDPSWAQALQRLAERQIRLSGQARQLFERK